MSPINLKKILTELVSKITIVDFEELLKVVNLIEKVRDRNNKIIIAGNGGSAAIASHISVDFTKAAGVRAINFNEADLITCYSNDFGYQNWVAEAIKSYGNVGDLIILISSSGSSMNIINAARTTRDMGLELITLSGFSSSNELKNIGNINLWVDSNNYNLVELTHLSWLLTVVESVKR